MIMVGIRDFPELTIIFLSPFNSDMTTAPFKIVRQVFLDAGPKDLNQFFPAETAVAHNTYFT